MKTIYRYTIEPNGIVTLPWGYEVLKIEWSIMHDEACLWAIVDTNESMVSVHLETVPTGSPLPAGVSSQGYLGSFQEPSGLVFHVFKY